MRIPVLLASIQGKKTKVAPIQVNILNLINFMHPSGMGERYFFDHADIHQSEIKTRCFPGFAGKKETSRDRCKDLLGEKHRPIEFQISNFGVFFFNPHSAIHIPQFRSGRFSPFLTVVFGILGSNPIFMYNYFLQGRKEKNLKLPETVDRCRRSLRNPT